MSTDVLRRLTNRRIIIIIIIITNRQTLPHLKFSLLQAKVKLGN